MLHSQPEQYSKRAIVEYIRCAMFQNDLSDDEVVRIFSLAYPGSTIRIIEDDRVQGSVFQVRFKRQLGPPPNPN